MGLFTGFAISGSGLTAQRLNLDVIAGNIANAETTRSGRMGEDGRPLPYRRQTVIFEANNDGFASILRRAAGSVAGGVRVRGIVPDPSDFPLVYNPDHPDADDRGYVMMPNVNMIGEMVDLMAATRAYDANVSAFNASKEMCARALEIGRR